MRAVVVEGSMLAAKADGAESKGLGLITWWLWTLLAKELGWVDAESR